MNALAVWAYPHIDPVALRLGPLAVRWYGLAYVATFVFAWWVLRRADRRWRLGLSADDRAFVVLAAVIGVVAGGRLGYVVFYGAGLYWREPVRMLYVWDGGMSFHGGLAGIMAAGVVVSRRLGVPFLRLCDIGAVAAPMGFGLGRLANFVNGELWGRVSAAPWAMVFPRAGALPRHPSQLYEALLEGAVLLAVMWWLDRRTRPPGELLGWMLLLYGVMRTAVEFFREPDAQIGFLAGRMTMGQLLSVPMVAAGVVLLWRSRRPTSDQAGGSSSDGDGGSAAGPDGGGPAD